MKALAQLLNDMLAAGVIADYVTAEQTAALAERHGLATAWQRFRRRFLDG
jgi:pyridoxal biosynthesis lyase PdxS